MPGKPTSESDDWWNLVWIILGALLLAALARASLEALPGWVDQAATAFCQRWTVSTCGPAEGIYR